MPRSREITYRIYKVDARLVRDMAKRLVGRWVVLYSQRDGWKGVMLTSVSDDADAFTYRKDIKGGTTRARGIWRIHKESLFYNPITDPVPMGFIERGDGRIRPLRSTPKRGKVRRKPPTTTPKEGTTTMAKATTKKGAKGAKGTKAAKAAKKNGGTTTERMSDKERMKLAAQIVKLRDKQGKTWAEIGEITGIESGSQRRNLYNAGGGEASGSRGKSAAAESPAKSKKSSKAEKSAKASKGSSKKAKGKKVTVKRGKGSKAKDPS